MIAPLHGLGLPESVDSDVTPSEEAKSRHAANMNEGARIAIMGAGHVGATTAYALILSGLASEIVLIDPDVKRARAEAADLAHAAAFAQPVRVRAGSCTDAADASIAILTAGGSQRPGETRLDMVARSATIVRQCIDDLMAAGFSGILLIAANPVDLMTQLAVNHSGLPAARVLGSGTLLDSARLRVLLAEAHGVAPQAVAAYVVGEHGDSEIAVFGTAQIGGSPLSTWKSASSPETLQQKVRDAGYLIVDGKGYTSFGVASALTRICAAILRDEHAVLPVSSRLDGSYGIADLCLSLPCIVGREGRMGFVALRLTADELAGLQASAAVLRQLIDEHGL